MKYIHVRGASENNLQGLSVDLPREALTVITGVSGSGKSSLAFDTIYKEGHRRFLESLSAYARRFLGGIDKPDVDSIEGLSPSISIEQRTIQRNPRSTVGTMTEIYDHLRLLYARLGVPHCPSCSKVIDSQSAEQVAGQLLAVHRGARGLFCAPLVRERRGAFASIFAQLKKDGFRRLLIDGEMTRLEEEIPALDPAEIHSIDIIYDRLDVSLGRRSRIVEAVERCFALADDTFRFIVDGTDPGDTENQRLFSGRFSCADCEVDLPALNTRIFSFNLPAGMCPGCRGTGVALQVDPGLLIASSRRPLLRGGLAVDFTMKGKGRPAFDPGIPGSLLRHLGLGTDATWEQLDQDARDTMLHGAGELPGLLEYLDEARTEDEAFLNELATEGVCRQCAGQRLSGLSRSVEFSGATIGSLCDKPIDDLKKFFAAVELEGTAGEIACPIIEEITRRLCFLEDVGLGYLTLGRAAPSLAGGEVQRVRLAGQLGSALQGVVFVLDEPSVGLHSRDNRRLLDALAGLRDRGNSVIVVEHDRETIELADHVIDMGPGAGVEGGCIIAEGTAAEIAKEPNSLTGDYLAGRKKACRRTKIREPWRRAIRLEGVTRNNLRDCDVEIPLERMVAISGVSGSGKSTLINQVLHPALLRKLGKKAGSCGEIRKLSGHEFIDKIICVNQAAIGRNSRSNPATYSKIFTLIRELFSRLPEARARGYRPARFSFNVDGGRCIECGGAGLQSVDMQFLAPVEVICEACGGQRYNRETLEIRYRGKNIAEILDLTVKETLDIFSTVPRIYRVLETLDRLGLGYLKLGQPATTLSGGEGQRLKLANELQKTSTGKTLYLLDEPTTGLHFEDVRILLDALDGLVKRGNSVLVIEHNLDVIGAADHVIDLGPEGGNKGGRVVAAGTPAELSSAADSFTARALRDHLAGGPAQERGPSGLPGEAEARPDGIRIEGASLNNLKAVDVTIPHEKLTVLTGVSGSGKSSLAFGTLFAEGQRRYLDSLSTYARHFLGNLSSPPVEKITGMAPAIAIDQKSGTATARSTVATITEVHDYLRLLYAHVGTPHCPECDRLLAWSTPSRLSEEIVSLNAGAKMHILAPLCIEEASGDALRKTIAELVKDGCTRVLVAGDEIRLDEGEDAALRRLLNCLPSDDTSRHPQIYLVADRVVISESVQSRIAASIENCYSRTGGVAATRIENGEIQRHCREPSCPDGHFTFDGSLSPRMFSFNSFEGACPSCKGAGSELKVVPEELIVEAEKPLRGALSEPLRTYMENFRPSALVVLEAVERHLGLEGPYSTRALPEETLDVLLRGLGEKKISLTLKMGQHEASWSGLATLLEEWARSRDPNLAGAGLERLFVQMECASCHGQRLRPESLAVRVADKGIHDLLALSIEDVRDFFQGIALSAKDEAIAGDVLRELSNRLRFLEDVGLGYLTLDRRGNTLSGGEAQRIRLASQLGNRLTGAIYVLDEPTIGLHEWDTRGLLGSLAELKASGNTVVVVEHDRQMIEAADYLVDMGPGAGDGGGEIVAEGTPRDMAGNKESLTGRYLCGSMAVDAGRDRRAPAEPGISLHGIRRHNLAGLDVNFPSGVLAAITGISGSGKSTLVMEILAGVMKKHLRGTSEFEHVDKAAGLDGYRRLVTVNQKPLGRSRSSTPATYAGAWDLVRSLFAKMPLAMTRGYNQGRFSFNSAQGQCAACEGQGARQVEMQFLSDIWVVCEECGGRRFNKSTLEVHFKGKNVADVLNLEIEEACDFFANQPGILKFLQSMKDVGLGYLKLGQSSPSLSTGEAQRVKLATELAGESIKGTLYILDEPTTGLHFSEVRKLLEILNRLVDGGGSVVVIEHNIDIVNAADWVIDMGPGAGPQGGQIVYEGLPGGLRDCHESKTGECLRAKGIGGGDGP